MPVGRDEGLDPSGRFARYKPGGFATLPEGVVLELVARRVGRNGWAVMVALCREDPALDTAPPSSTSIGRTFTTLQNRIPR